MIKQAAIGLNSREEANPFNKDGFLPLITAPMYSVVDDTNYQVFLDNKIQVCLPRGHYDELYVNRDLFYALSLNEFVNRFVNDDSELNIQAGSIKVCIDTANGNMPALHDAIRKAKEIHGSNLIIMAGNVASAEAFVELGKTGVDYIRIGIGGGGGCNTTSNTGVGQENLEELITHCKNFINYYKQEVKEYFYNTAKYIKQNGSITNDALMKWQFISRVKIVADGISSYIKQCEIKHGFNDNGYAAINKLLFAGADLVMVGKLFAQCIESAGEKGIFDPTLEINPIRDLEEFNEDTGANDVGDPYESYLHVFLNTTPDSKNPVMVKYAGMSTQEEQLKYKKPNVKVGDVFYLKNDTLKSVPIKCTMIEHGFHWGIVQNCSNCKETGYSWNTIQNFNKPSEGSVQWIPVRWTLDEWLNGSDKQDEAPYLMGWINSIKSAMSYVGKTKLY